MDPTPPAAATLSQPTPERIVLAGSWTAPALGAVQRQVQALAPGGHAATVADGSAIEALDTAGACLLHQLLRHPNGADGDIVLEGLSPRFRRLMDALSQQFAQQAQQPVAAPAPRQTGLGQLGQVTAVMAEQAVALLSFVGEIALAGLGSLAHPQRIRWRPVLHHIRIAGLDALPIVGLLSFLLGVVVAYQGADQLRQFGANIFVVDLVGVSMLREFAPLITAIIVAGRSGSAYAAQIGTMAVTEEIDALRTIGIAPLELLVLPKLTALLIALPLLTVFADLMGVLGGMLMARSQLGVGYAEFAERFIKAVGVGTYFVGLAKAPVFAAIIAVVGCFQGFRTHGGADSVGRQTTTSVVQAIFMVIVADALFSVAFSALDL